MGQSRGFRPVSSVGACLIAWTAGRVGLDGAEKITFTKPMPSPLDRYGTNARIIDAMTILSGPLRGERANWSYQIAGRIREASQDDPVGTTREQNCEHRFGQRREGRRSF